MAFAFRQIAVPLPESDSVRKRIIKGPIEYLGAQPIGRNKIAINYCNFAYSALTEPKF
jgi:hypothetical protein